MVTYANGVLWVENRSRNGTYLNSKLVERAPMHPNDQIQIAGNGNWIPVTGTLSGDTFTTSGVACPAVTPERPLPSK